ncbi:MULTISPECIES: STAS domain-containing protein [unclassified Bacillus (in: firmicutes)]|uniref:STAS domain-containing protein n=1 Tax=unclassified Bacillus (in: firmicutes) TaxID=185979 RepID=UPI0008E96852|nr:MULTISPECIES: STAS domain-containing protein [unclassified Bacillus (in: firmicutes)]SFB04134.1 Anti-anti-sigma regulatory factor (antagonist of anti-sigma factor) [Bacillus sp. UNCCL13]SFQ88579.1 Anti-anti-sigma regulatory factor (antagonist of anti-sigma factor) [Bacillus sp. cl95]
MDSNINIGGLDFGWDLENGRFLFEGQDAVLFWISSAMKTFFDTIEEISGEESSNLVFETTGFRQGLVVGEYFQNMKDINVFQATEVITNTYASAGWGRTEIKDLDAESKTLTVHLKDSWEHKINVAQEKNKSTNFLAAHYAGIFTGLFGSNTWYKVVQDQLDGHEYSVIEYFPTDITVANNIHQLARKKESQQILHLEAIVEEKTRELKALVKKLSSPIIPVLDGIVVVPLIGKYDEERSEELVIKTLTNLPSHQANYLILDLTALDKDISEHTTSLINKIGSAASLIGTKTVLVGISAELGKAISESNINFSKFDCFQTLQHGILYALGQLGRKIL